MSPGEGASKSTGVCEMRRIVHHGIDELMLRQALALVSPCRDSDLAIVVRDAALGLNLPARLSSPPGTGSRPKVTAGEVDVRVCRLPGRRVNLEFYVDPEALYRRPNDA